ncbi:MAG: rod shape-determining protein MreD [Marmoricola sp.]
MSALRVGALAILLLVLITTQDAVLRYLSVWGVVPNLALLLVIAAAVVRGSDYGAGLGFVAGLLLDLVPPATGTAGRWALALVIAGFLAGKVSGDVRGSRRAMLVLVAGCSFVATSVYALSGVMLGDVPMESGRMPLVIVVGVIVDVVAAAILLPSGLTLMRRLRPARASL